MSMQRPQPSNQRPLMANQEEALPRRLDTMRVAEPTLRHFHASSVQHRQACHHARPDLSH